MKTLILNRHAKSSWKDLGMNDFERPLNDRGFRDAPVMGERFAAKGGAPDLILSSSANRAITTAEIMAEKIGYPVSDIKQDENLYLASVSILEAAVHVIDDNHSTAMIFGHNPGMTEFANYLTGGNIENVPTCGIVYCDFEIDSWGEVREGIATLREFDYPKNSR